MLKTFALPFLVGLFLFLRIFNLEKGVNFSAEQGLFLDKAYQIYKTKKLTLIGPATSIKAKISREFYQGPATYYFLIPPLVLFRGDPIAVSYYLIFLNSLALILIYLAIQRKFGAQTAFWSGFFFTTIPQNVTYSRFVWNPNFLPLFSAILLVLFNFGKQKGFIFFLLLGFILGFSLQFHYQIVLLIFVIFIWLTVKKTDFSKFFPTILGICLGFSPIIIFELRHNFYNLRTIFLILKSGTSKTVFFPPPFYYFLCFSSFMVLFLGFLTSKLMKWNKFVGSFLISAYFLWATKSIFSFANKAPGMPQGWNYLGEKKVANIILEQNKESYNVANLLTGDTRSMAIRYLLTVRGKPPMDVESYPQADWLFVLSRYDEQRTKNNPVWEISSFVPSKLVKQWPIQNGISLYLFEKKLRVNLSTSKVETIKERNRLYWKN